MSRFPGAGGRVPRPEPTGVSFVYASYGNGTFEWGGSWQQLTTAVATQIAAGAPGGEFEGFYATFGNGTFEYNDYNGFIRLSPYIASHLGNDGMEMIASYGSGTYTYEDFGSDPGWHQITPLQASLVG